MQKKRGQKERREHDSCSGNEDSAMDKWLDQNESLGADQKGPCNKAGHTRGCQSINNDSNSGTAYIKRREDKLLRNMREMVEPWKRRNWRPRRRWIDNTMEDINKYGMTSGMTVDIQCWKFIMNAGPQRCEDGL